MGKKLVYMFILFVSLFIFYNVDNVKADTKTLSCCYSSGSDCNNSDDFIEVEIKYNTNNHQIYESPVIMLKNKTGGVNAIKISDHSSETRFTNIRLNAKNIDDFKTSIENNGRCPSYALLVTDTQESKKSNRKYEYYFSNNSSASDVDKSSISERKYVVLKEVRGNTIVWNGNSNVDTGVEETTDFEENSGNETIETCNDAYLSGGISSAISSGNCSNGIEIYLDDSTKPSDYKSSIVYDKVNDEKSPFPNASNVFTYKRRNSNEKLYIYTTSEGTFLYLNLGAYNQNFKLDTSVLSADNSLLFSSKDQYGYIWHLNIHNIMPMTNLKSSKILYLYKFNSEEYVRKVKSAEESNNTTRYYKKGCEMFKNSSGEYGKTYGYLKWAITMIRYAIPVLIFVFGITEYLKILLSGEEKEMKEAQRRVIIRVVIGLVALVFPSILKLLINLSGLVTGTSSGDVFCDLI